MTPTSAKVSRTALRLWPGVALVVAQWLLRFVIPALFPAAVAAGVIGAMACGVGVIVWWLFFSRANWGDRVGALLVIVAGVAVTYRLVHPSIAGGMMGLMLPVSSVPVLCAALVGWAAVTRGRRAPVRWATLAAAVAVGCGFFTLLRTNGISGAGSADLHWRWTKTHEERLLAEAGQPAPARRETNRAAAAAPTMTAEWPGFRGAERDGVVRGVRLDPDWKASPPVELWRRPVGPGWSSFAVHEDRVYTQEQLGDDEVVSCFSLSTGDPLWQHRDRVRFYESNAGAGPRGTPTYHEGRVYAFGATGVLNALDAVTGGVIWSRTVTTDRHTTVPTWGFSSSPLVLGDIVAVAAGGKLVGYDRVSGKLRWFGPAHGGGYSSPQRATLDGVPQVLLLSAAGATSVAPATGKVLWEHGWEGSSIVQPAVMTSGDVLISTGGASGGLGTRRLAVAHRNETWNVEERWTSRGLKPYFNDSVVQRDHAFGFDGSTLACIALEDGERKWKGGRYGNGQLLLLADQDVLLVLSEQGDVALVAAATDAYKELARFHAISGKTWNHPVLVGDVLLVRNGEERAAFRLALAKR